MREDAAVEIQRKNWSQFVIATHDGKSEAAKCLVFFSLLLLLSCVNRMWKEDVNYFENKEKIYMEIDLCRYRMSSHVSAAKCFHVIFIFSHFLSKHSLLVVQ